MKETGMSISFVKCNIIMMVNIMIDKGKPMHTIQVSYKYKNRPIFTLKFWVLEDIRIKSY